MIGKMYMFDILRNTTHTFCGSSGTYRPCNMGNYNSQIYTMRHSVCSDPDTVFDLQYNKTLNQFEQKKGGKKSRTIHNL